jgi:hypothetical protein
VASPLVTRGMGTNSAIVTQGYGGIVSVAAAAVAEVVRQAVIKGKSAAKYIPEILYIVKAALVEVNDKELTYPITGINRKIVKVDDPEPTITAELKTEDVKSALREILIKVAPSVRTRILDGKKNE